MWSFCPYCRTPLGHDLDSRGGKVCSRCGRRLVAETQEAQDDLTTPYLARRPGTEPDPNGPAPEAPDEPAEGLPGKLGRYAVRSLLGQGAFGAVYLGHDAELDRLVAIKVPHADRLGSEATIQSVLREARIAAGLRHPGIVAVHDFGRLEDGTCYFVMEYVAGRPLAQVLREEPLSYARVAEVVLELADALKYAHEQGLVHRDLKPSNILIDATGHPRIADFGLAVDEQTQYLLQGQVAGTPAYMAPEQVRGESHRLEGRTDLWSLGVILYEVLVGRRPFVGARDELFDQILHHEPRPPRQVCDAVPRELERICLRCLAKRMRDRYPTAGDLADDLRSWRDREAEASGTAPGGRPLDAGPDQAGPLPETKSIVARVVPKGLRAFDAGDAEFFLQLLPGPRDRHGLPVSVGFWKSRLEETDGDKTFGVGVLYGPSGCGKSSLVKAGLLPRLASHVLVVYGEATPNDTEARLLRGVGKHCPRLDPALGLVPTVAGLREGVGLPPGKKVVLILDQFEQWLHVNRALPDPDLVRALRQCDGEHVQCLLLVRDDFWMAITSFLHDLEVSLVEGHNSAPVDLFGTRHARHVLAEFGRAFGCLPDAPAARTPEQEQFLDLAVRELAQDGKVIPLRLSLLAEMMKTRAWTPGTLRTLGGTHGLGATFLEETFSAPSAPPGHRRHDRAARAVLQVLLPQAGADLKGAVRSRQDLLTVSGYDRRPQDFEDLLRILDTELRLVTPTDPEASPIEEQSAIGNRQSAMSYQLTHDYLVPSVREWLTRKQKESWRGRAQLTLAERTAQWSRSPANRFLPSLGEYLAICLAVPRGHRSAEQAALLRATGRYQARRWGTLLVVLLVLGLVLQQYLAFLGRTARRHQAATLVEAALQAPPEGVPYLIEDLRPLRDEAVPLLRARFNDESLEPRRRLHAAVVLAAFGDVAEDYLLESIATAPPSESRNVLGALVPARDAVRQPLRDWLARERDPRVRLRIVITLLYLGDSSAARDWLAFRPDPGRRTAFVQDFATWQGDLSGLAVLLEQADDPALTSGLCAALGTIPPDTLGGDVQGRLQQALRTLYRAARDGSTHSAASWALRQSGVELPDFGPDVARPGDRRWFVNAHGMTMLEVLPGSYVMGDPSDAALARPHPVKLTRRFFLCDREVPLGLLEQFIADPDPAVEKPVRWSPPTRSVIPSADCPVVMVNWVDAVLFCNWLSRREGRRACYTKARVRRRAVESGKEKEVESEEWRCDFTADGYRLPTEAEWEYACRAGTVTAWSFGDDESRLAGYAVYHRTEAVPGASRLPNDWGFFDMHGNAREWCWDWFQPNYPSGPATDPTGPETGLDHIHRGGSWYDHPQACRSAFRNRSQLALRDLLIGFRVACGVPDQ